MTEFSADYFDGIRARAHPVLVQVHPVHILVSPLVEPEAQDGLQAFTVTLASLQIQPGLGKTRRIIELPDGARLEAQDIGSLASLQKSQGNNAFWRALHYLENHLQWVLLALVLTVAAGWGLLKFGVPLLAEQVAIATPLSVEKDLGKQVLAGMDYKYAYFSPSKIPQVRRNAISIRLNSVCSRQRPVCPAYQLEFRASEAIGANAFALPGGYIVVTDALIQLAENDDEIVAVLAHEVGHVAHRHAFRQTLQGALSGLILVAATGDVSSLASGLPAVLLQLSYTRSMENEADLYALNALHAACVQPHVFADMLQRLTQQSHAKAIPEIISSHPDTLARIRPFQITWQDCTI